MVQAGHAPGGAELGAGARALSRGASRDLAGIPGRGPGAVRGRSDLLSLRQRTTQPFGGLSSDPAALAGDPAAGPLDREGPVRLRSRAARSRVRVSARKPLGDSPWRSEAARQPELAAKARGPGGAGAPAHWLDRRAEALGPGAEARVGARRQPKPDGPHRRRSRRGRRAAAHHRAAPGARSPPLADPLRVAGRRARARAESGAEELPLWKVQDSDRRRPGRPRAVPVPGPVAASGRGRSGPCAREAAGRPGVREAPRRRCAREAPGRNAGGDSRAATAPEDLSAEARFAAARHRTARSGHQGRGLRLVSGRPAEEEPLRTAGLHEVRDRAAAAQERLLPVRENLPSGHAAGRRDTGAAKAAGGHPLAAQRGVRRARRRGAPEGVPRAACRRRGRSRGRRRRGHPARRGGLPAGGGPDSGAQASRGARAGRELHQAQRQGGGVLRLAWVRQIPTGAGQEGGLRCRDERRPEGA